MRLVVDGLFLRPGRVGGIEFMLYSLLSALARAASPGDRIRVLVPEGADLSDRPFAAELEQVTVTSPSNRFAAVERRLPRNHDVALFANYYTPLRTLLERDRPSITVVHDLQFRAFPENFTTAKRVFQRAALQATSRLASAVVAISDFTRGEIAAAYPAARTRLHTIPNPVDWDRFDPEQPPAQDLGPGPVFLLAAAQYRHKNIATAVEGFRAVQALHPDARLVVVGQVPELMRETRVGSALPEVPGVLQLGFVPDAVLAWLLKRADAVLLPSLYEGCGLPCAEALGLGTRVVHSGRAALPEIAGEHGLVVDDPLSPASWADAVGRVVDGLAPRPDAAAVAAVRTAHDPVAIGERYWALARSLRAGAGAPG